MWCAGKCAPRLFLRTTEFLWQEGHTAHADAAKTRWTRPLQMLEVYRDFAEDVLAMPVIAGEKPENERFPGAVDTYSIEAMMQDGKALQAGTSHYLGHEFRRGAEHPLPERRPASWSSATPPAGASPRA